MTPFFVYLLKSSLSLTLFYIVFRLVMSRDKNHSLNRFLLLGILIASAIIPLLNFQFFKEEVIIQPVSVIRDFIYTPIEFGDVPQAATTMAADPVKKGIEINWWLLGYGLVIAVLFARLIISLLSVVQLVRTSEKMPLKKIVIAVIKKMIQPFSFLHYIVISEKDYTENKNVVIAHEQEHIRQLHSIDLLICELYTLLHWFNPVIWLLRQDLKLIHEYQADQAVLNNGIDAKKYQLLVIEKAVGERRFALANHFTQKPILKRIKMMKTNKKSRWGPVKLLLFVPLAIFLLQAFTKPEIINEVSNKISPLLFEKDSTVIWLQKWKSSNIKTLNEFDLPKDEINGRFQIGDVRVSEKNVLMVLQDKSGRLMVEKQIVEFEELKKIAKNFIKGKAGKFTNPEFIEKDISLIGKAKVSIGVILYRKDIASPEDLVNKSFRAFGEAYLEVRNEAALEKFGLDYFSLDKSKRSAIDKLIPIRITTGTPKRIGIANKQKIEWSYENLESIGEEILTEIGHNPTYGDFKKTKAVSLNNVLLLLIDKDKNIRVKGEVVKKEDLKSIISNFVVDGINSDGEKVSEVITKELPHFGKVDVPQGFINFRFNVSVPYWSVRETIDYIGEVFSKIKDEKSFQVFNHPYLMLSENDQSEIDQIVPIRISTGEPIMKDGVVAFADGI